MNHEILELIKYLSIESLCFAIVTFLLTMLIKWPIKKLTSKLIEEKRKAVNIAILFIPAVISLIISFSYYGIFKSNWVTISIIDTGLSSWVISLSIYAIYERIVIVIKALKSGKPEINSKLTSKTISSLKDTLKSLKSNLKEKVKNLEQLSEKLKSLKGIKSVLESDSLNKDIAKLSETNIQIQSLINEEKLLQTKITEIKNQIDSYTQKLYVTKGE